jgi:hypothetical protein
MHELALSTSGHTHRKSKYVVHRPRGSCIVHCSTSQKRRKWLEIVCDFAHPRRSHEFDSLKYPIPNWDEIKLFWTKNLYDNWRSADSPSVLYPSGQLLTNRSFPQTFWDDEVKVRGLEDDVDDDPRGDVKITDTWLFSHHERTKYFVIVDNSLDDSTSDLFGSQVENMDATVGRIFSRSAIIDYRVDLGLTQKTMGDIADPTTVVHPKFNNPISVELKQKLFDVDKASFDIIAEYPELGN